MKTAFQLSSPETGTNHHLYIRTPIVNAATAGQPLTAVLFIDGLKALFSQQLRRPNTLRSRASTAYSETGRTIHCSASARERKALYSSCTSDIALKAEYMQVRIYVSLVEPTKAIFGKVPRSGRRFLAAAPMTTKSSLVIRFTDPSERSQMTAGKGRFGICADIVSTISKAVGSPLTRKVVQAEPAITSTCAMRNTSAPNDHNAVFFHSYALTFRGERHCPS